MPTVTTWHRTSCAGEHQVYEGNGAPDSLERVEYAETLHTAALEVAGVRLRKRGGGGLRLA